MHEKYAFRVRARNDHGYGNWSEVSAVVDLTDMTRAMVIAQEHLGLILGLAVPAVTIVLLCFCYFLCRKCYGLTFLCEIDRMEVDIWFMVLLLKID